MFDRTQIFANLRNKLNNALSQQQDDVEITAENVESLMPFFRQVTEIIKNADTQDNKAHIIKSLIWDWNELINNGNLEDNTPVIVFDKPLVKEVDYTVAEEGGGGDCYFHAAASFLEPKITAVELRQRVCDKLLEKRCFVVAQNGQNLQVQGIWADDTLFPAIHQALADVAGKRVYILRSDNNIFTLYQPGITDDYTNLKPRELKIPHADERLDSDICMYNINDRQFQHFKSLAFTQSFKQKIKDYTIYPASETIASFKPYASIIPSESIQIRAAAVRPVRRVAFHNAGGTPGAPISRRSRETRTTPQSILRTSTQPSQTQQSDTFAEASSQHLLDQPVSNFIQMTDANLAFPYIVVTGDREKDFATFKKSVLKDEINPWLREINNAIRSTNAFLKTEDLYKKVRQINKIKADPSYAPDEFAKHVWHVWHLSPAEYQGENLMYTKPRKAGAPPPPSAAASREPFLNEQQPRGDVAPPETPPLQQQKGMTKESIISAMLFGALISIMFFMLMGRNWLLFFLPLTLVFLAISAMQVQYAPAASLKPDTPERSDAVIVVSRIIAAVWALEFIFMVDVYYPKPSLGWTFAMGITIFLAIFMNIGGILWMQQRLAPENSSY